MQNKIIYSPKALHDLDAIWDYIESELCNPVAAQHIVDGIVNRIDALVDFPESGAKLVFDNNLDSGYRYVIFQNYFAFYRLRQNHIIYVDRVIYRGRDYMRLLFLES